MPSIILAPIKITQVSSSAAVTFGDVYQISPTSTLKSYSGSGGGNTGDFQQTNNFISLTHSVDPDIIDSVNKSIGD